MRYRLANETQEYRDQRQALLEAELLLRDQRERVAELRRGLMVEAPVDDYLLQRGPSDLDAGDDPIDTVRLSELFERPERVLVLMHFMYGKKQLNPCPSCTLWADGYNGIVPHLQERVNFAVLAAAAPAEFRAHARSRGWHQLLLLSAADSTLKADLGFEDDETGQEPGVSVFSLGDDGVVRHFYSGGAILGPGEYRGMDLLSPLWHFLDLTPEGRGDWDPSLAYG